jgi:hypothetical protein
MAVRVLRDLQAQAEKENPWDTKVDSITLADVSKWPLPFPTSDTDAARQYEAIVERLTALKNQLPTEHEDPTAYHIFGAVLDRVLSQTIKNGLPEHIYYGTAEFLTPNSTTISLRADHEEILIVFNRALIPFCLQISGFIANVLVRDANPKHGINLQSLSREPERNEVLILHDILADAIRRVEHFYGADGKLDQVGWDRLVIRSPLYLSDAARALREIILEAIEGFVVGHEVGHAMLLKSSNRANYQEQVSKLTKIRDLYSDEHVCDQLGQRLGLGATHKRFPDLPVAFVYTIGVIGGPLFLSALRLAELATHLVRRGEPMKEEVPDLDDPSPPATSHPGTFLRIHQLIRNIQQQIDPELNPDKLGDPIAVYRATHTFLDRCWNQLEPVFRAHHLDFSNPDVGNGQPS